MYNCSPVYSPSTDVLLLIVCFTACCKPDDRNCQGFPDFEKYKQIYCTSNGANQGAALAEYGTDNTKPFSVLCPRLCGLCDTDYVRPADCPKPDPSSCTNGFLSYG